MPGPSSLWSRTHLRLVMENIALLDSLNRLAETGYSTGMVRQNEVLRTQIERSRMEEMRIGLEQRQKSLAAMFAALLHRPMDAPPPVVSATIVPVSQTAAELEELAFRSRPELFARSARLEQARTSETLARREYYPDFTLSFEYMQRDAFSGDPESMGEDMYSAGVTFNLPVQRQKRRAMVAEAQAQGRMAEAEIEQLRHEIRRGISDYAGANLTASAAMAQLYDERHRPAGGVCHRGPPFLLQGGEGGLDVGPRQPDASSSACASATTNSSRKIRCNVPSWRRWSAPGSSKKEVKMKQKIVIPIVILAILGFTVGGYLVGRHSSRPAARQGDRQRE